MPSPRTEKIPNIHEDVFIAPNSVIIGDVTIDKGANIWFGVILRADWGSIKIGKNTSVQEHATIHIEAGRKVGVEIGDNCIIGHHAMVHGPCVIEDGCLVGIGALAIQNSKLGKGSLLGAGAVLVNKEIPPRSLAVGVPAEVKKQFPDKGPLIGERTTGEYVKNGEIFKEFFRTNPDFAKF